MSVVVTDKVKGRTSGTETNINDLKFQIASAWVNFNGTGTVAINDSYNVSSIIDNGTGDYTVNFATALANADYMFTMGAQRNAGQEPIISVPNPGPGVQPSTTQLGVIAKDESGTSRDYASTCISIFGGV